VTTIKEEEEQAFRESFDELVCINDGDITLFLLYNRVLRQAKAKELE
jgi:hypothetical protein